MVYYKQLLLMNPNSPPGEIVGVLKRIVQAAWDGGGVVRKMENIGLQLLPYKFKDKVSGSGTIVRHSKARVIFGHLEVSPKTLKSIEDTLRIEVPCLRFTTLKVKDDPVARAANLAYVREWQPYNIAHYKKITQVSTRPDYESFVPWIEEAPHDEIFHTDQRLYYSEFLDKKTREGTSLDSLYEPETTESSIAPRYQEKVDLAFRKAAEKTNEDPQRVAAEVPVTPSDMSVEEWQEAQESVFSKEEKSTVSEQVQGTRRRLLALANQITLSLPSIRMNSVDELQQDELRTDSNLDLLDSEYTKQQDLIRKGLLAVAEEYKLAQDLEELQNSDVVQKENEDLQDLVTETLRVMDGYEQEHEGNGKSESGDDQKSIEKSLLEAVTGLKRAAETLYESVKQTKEGDERAEEDYSAFLRSLMHTSEKDKKDLRERLRRNNDMVEERFLSHISLDERMAGYNRDPAMAQGTYNTFYEEYVNPSIAMAKATGMLDKPEESHTDSFFGDLDEPKPPAALMEEGDVETDGLPESDAVKRAFGILDGPDTVMALTIDPYQFDGIRPQYTDFDLPTFAEVLEVKGDVLDKAEEEFKRETAEKERKATERLAKSRNQSDE